MTATPARQPATDPGEDATPGGHATSGGRVLLAAPRGYCAGVDRAVIAVEQALEQYGAPIYVRHEIVHNKYVVRSLEQKGAVFVEETEEVPPGEIVIFSAHGVAPTVHEEAERGKLATVDATCPLVTKVHKEAVRYAKDDYDILLIGHEGHEEVIGTSGEAPEHITVVDGPDDVENVRVRDPEKVVWLSQTTLSVDETMETVDALQSRYPNLLSPPSDDICYATQNRQTAIKELAARSDLVLVVGSQNSSNSVRLVETALSHGARDGHLVDNAEEIDEAWLEGVDTIGLSSGASVPEVLIDGVLEWLAARGWDGLEVVQPVQEHMQFSLPKELRRDLRAEAAKKQAG
ncbi:4-hydroxy-3-methylbut-2-enyl diphosphate reductase [Streptomyces oceani]|uniref:4-hydroxy-3-methylbut-2-enyl diphosphate reductase n=1 Tax=Streptomyces oceani TaxID=1075402 RepID=UPI0009A0B7BA|nr:4-hydroxy-3-methylbut-2-enyl diphosphate reductase [Streptomyces oceani]